MRNEEGKYSQTFSQTVSVGESLISAAVGFTAEQIHTVFFVLFMLMFRPEQEYLICWIYILLSRSTVCFTLGEQAVFTCL